MKCLCKETKKQKKKKKFLINYEMFMPNEFCLFNLAYRFNKYASHLQVCCGHLIIGRGFSFVDFDLLFYFILVDSNLRYVWYCNYGYFLYNFLC